MVKHEVILRRYGAADGEGKGAPVIVKRTGAEFIPGLLDGLRQGQNAELLGSPNLRQDVVSPCFHLFQPVHRTFNLVVLEAACGPPSFPRLDPRNIESAGLVVRRVGTLPSPPSPRTLLERARKLGNGRAEESSNKANLSLEAHPSVWAHCNEMPRGWKALDDTERDPDPARRPRLVTANPAINGKLAELLGRDEAERVAPLFVAPPDVCAAAKRTLLYGVIPVTSTEESEEAEVPALTDDDVTEIMPTFLRALGGPGRPAGVDDLTLAAVDTALQAALGNKLFDFVQELRMIQFGWGAFAPGGEDILRLLNQIPVQFSASSEKLGLGGVLQKLCAFAILRTEISPENGKLPVLWDQPPAAVAQELRAAVGRRLQARLGESVRPGRRFDDERAVYRLRAFVRVRCPDGCPPKIQWSNESEPFTIAPWWENGGPVHTIALPDLDRDSVKRLVPNVAFALPPKLAALLNQNSPDSFLKGEAKPGDPGLGWICSFSIPVITLCAFIVLNIFLQLLHIVFQWLFYIKICLPFPKPPPPAPARL